MRDTVIGKILEHKLIAIIRGIKKEDLSPLVQALYDGGFRLAEITFSADGSTPDEEVAKSIKMLSEEFRGRMHIGAGTVLKESQVRLVAEAGGEFIISPDAYTAVIEETRRLGLVSIPGVVTPTEIQNAIRAGADFVKLFPAVSLGPAYVKAIKAPLSSIKLLAVGGIDRGNMGEYFKAGACGFGIGGKLVDRSLVERGDFAAITAIAREYVEEARKW